MSAALMPVPWPVELMPVWKPAGRLGRQPRPEPARLVTPNHSPAHPNGATCRHVAAAGSDRQVIAIRAAHIALQRQPRPLLRAPGTTLRRGSAAIKPAAA